MGVASVVASQDAMAWRAKALTVWGARVFLDVGGSSTLSRRAWLHFAPPSEAAGATLVRATLVLTHVQAPQFGDPGVLRVRRVNGVRWSQSTINWANQPPVTPTDSNPTVEFTPPSAPSAGTVWRVDVTTLIRPLFEGTAAGLAYQGLRLEASGPGMVKFASREWNGELDGVRLGGASWRPRLEFEWSAAPHAPSDLSPGGGLGVSPADPALRFRHADTEGDVTIQAVNVRGFATEQAAVANTGASSDVTVPTVEPEVLASQVGIDPTAVDTVWWRVRVQDGAGLWSGWSQPAEFCWRPLPTGGITSHTDGQTISDPTPLITWHYDAAPHSGQEPSRAPGWCLRTYRGAEEMYYSWVHRPDSSEEFELPREALSWARDGDEVRIHLVVWDDIDRQTVWGADYRAEDSVTVIFHPNGGQAAVSGLTATRVGPWVDLSWSRAEIPDGWAVWAQEIAPDWQGAGWAPAKQIASTADVTDWGPQSGPWKVRVFPTPRIRTRLSVRPVDDGVQGQAATVEVTTEPGGIWVIDPDGRLLPLMILGDDPGDVEWQDDSAWLDVVDSDRPVLMTRHVGGMRGTITGRIFAVDMPEEGHIRSETALMRLEQLRRHPGKAWRLVWHRWSILAVVRNVQAKPTRFPAQSGDPSDLIHDVSFEFRQTGFDGRWF